MEVRTSAYIAIDLKSFYASVECVERNLNPLTTNLVVADPDRTEKTICLAVSPSLKAYGIPGRPRLFEVSQKIREVNAGRLAGLSGHGNKAAGREFSGSSYDKEELEESPELAVSYITAPPRMALYIKYSTEIYNIYMKYAAPEDIHVYSIDEVFIDAAGYLKAGGFTPGEMAGKIIGEILETTGITAAAGIGTNLYLCKVAMDIMAKHVAPDGNGAQIAELDEMSYRKALWNHRPLTDFWRVGKGYAGKLEANGLFTMGDIARCSLGKPSDYHNEELLYKLFGVNAELLIDHAWGWEPCTISDIKAYKPEAGSIGSGQVLQHPYSFEKGKLIVREMADLLALELVDKNLATNQITLTIGYDKESLAGGEAKKKYKGPVTVDRYGRKVPKHAHGTANLKRFTSSSKLITEAAMELYDRIVDENLLIRRVYITASRVLEEQAALEEEGFGQLNLFTDYEALKEQRQKEKAELAREKAMQKVMLAIKKKYGKNAILKGMNLEPGAMTVERNRQIGGHKA